MEVAAVGIADFVRDGGGRLVGVDEKVSGAVHTEREDVFGQSRADDRRKEAA